MSRSYLDSSVRRTEKETEKDLASSSRETLGSLKKTGRSPLRTRAESGD